MDEDRRPDPEDLLKAIRLEEIKKKRGRLKIFLGMAAGAGKTYSMLEEAHRLNVSEVYIVSGTIDTHGREETEKLLDGLHHVPEKWVKYKETIFEELDIDKVLSMKPQLVLVDELAHSNIPGSRHVKRWQDVEELLNNGIDVYTTLNVQHIESLKDVVEKITGITIRETVPDAIIDAANYVQIIDITPKELLERLHQGKIYFGEQSIRAAENFFQEDKLTALRELLFRYSADKVDRDLRELQVAQGKESWKIREKLLVAISPRNHAQKLIRIAKRLANNLYVPWIALYVETGKLKTASEEKMLAKNLTLARELNAEVITISDTNIPETISRVANQKDITQVIIGNTPDSFLFQWFPRITILNRLVTNCVDTDIHIIRRTDKEPTDTSFQIQFPSLSRLLSYFVAACTVIALTVGLSHILPNTDYQVIGLIYLMAILGMSLFFRRGPLFFAALLSTLLWNYYFIPSIGSFSVLNEEDVALLALFFIGAILTGGLAEQVRNNKTMLLKREETTQALYEIARVITTSPSTKQILQSIKQKLKSLFPGHCDILLKTPEGTLDIGTSPDIQSDKQEEAAAMWVFENATEAGWSTLTLPSQRHYFLPIKGYHETVGVLAYRPIDKKSLSTEEKNFLYTVAQLLGTYLERTFTEERKHRLQYVDQTEKFYQLILNMISNQFQTPLNITRIALSELKNDKTFRDYAPGMKALYRIEYAMGQLVHVIENISLMAKITAGIAPLNKEKHAIKSLIDACIENVAQFIGSHKIQVNIQSHLPEIDFDFSLIESLISNLIFNALENSPPLSTVEINAKQVENSLLLSIADEGKGIPPEALGAIFEKFYRVPGTESNGLGLGLSIAKNIAEVHGGNLKAENRPQGGAKFTLFLPIKSS